MRVGFLLLLPFTVGLLFGQGKQVGFVLSKQGNWVWTSAGKSADVAAGDPVYDRNTARAMDPKARLTVALLDGTVKTFACPPLNPCVATFAAFRPTADAPLAARLLTVGKTFFTQREAMPVYAMSRGASAAEFQQAVLAMKDSELQIAPAVVRLSAGSFSIQMRSLQKNGMTYRGDFTWDPPASVGAMMAGILPGGYELTVNSSEGMRMGSTTVVVSSASTAPALRAEFDDGKRLTSAWPPETDPAAIRSFLNALLLDIAQRAR